MNENKIKIIKKIPIFFKIKFIFKKFIFFSFNIKNNKKIVETSK